MADQTNLATVLKATYGYCSWAIRTYGTPYVCRASLYLASAAGFSVRYPRTFARFVRVSRRHFSITRPVKSLQVLGPCYTKDLPFPARALLKIHTWQALEQAFCRQFLANLLLRSTIVWQYVRDTSLLTLEIRLCPIAEGEIDLVFGLNGSELYHATFVIAPASFFRMTSGSVVYVTCIQGAKGQKPLINAVTKLMLGVAPPMVLMSALEALAICVGARAIVAVSHDHQLFSPPHPQDRLQFLRAYDQFWEALDGDRIASGDFCLPLPLRMKERALFKPYHRRRAAARQSFRRSVASLVSERLRELAVGSNAGVPAAAARGPGSAEPSPVRIRLSETRDSSIGNRLAPP
jgi:uncharacterized protein VirK/YbjX